MRLFQKCTCILKFYILSQEQAYSEINIQNNSCNNVKVNDASGFTFSSLSNYYNSTLHYVFKTEYGLFMDTHIT